MQASADEDASLSTTVNKFVEGWIWITAVRIWWTSNSAPLEDNLYEEEYSYVHISVKSPFMHMSLVISTNEMIHDGVSQAQHVQLKVPGEGILSWYLLE